MKLVLSLSCQYLRRNSSFEETIHERATWQNNVQTMLSLVSEPFVYGGLLIILCQVHMRKFVFGGYHNFLLLYILVILLKILE